jgi:hypothetical protein
MTRIRGTEEVGYMLLDEFWGKVMLPRLRKLMDYYWGLERREHIKVVSEGGGEQDDPMSTTNEEKEVEVLTAITEAGNISNTNVLQKCGFRETRRFLHEDGAWRVDFVMGRSPAV